MGATGADLQSAIAALVKVTETVESVRWIELPASVLRFLLVPTPLILTEGTIRQHLEGKITVGLYAINPSTQRCKWVAIDADYVCNALMSSRDIRTGPLG